MRLAPSAAAVAALVEAEEAVDALRLVATGDAAEDGRTVPALPLRRKQSGA
jgi:hypothetical protein